MRRTPVPGALLLPAFLAAAASGCITPPAVFAAGGKVVPLPEFPPDTEEIAVPVEEGVSLRGVFVPADPGAPVVVHFLGSGDSVTAAWGAASSLAWDLRDRGCASVLLDYRGVGPSDGDRSPRNLRGDAGAAFGEAVRRAGGEDRVIVRGMSLGTLAAASLVEDGRRPAALVLVAPVRAETVAVNFGYRWYWDPLVFLAAPFLRSAGDVDLLAALRRCGCPLLVLAGSDDALLPPDEAALARSACVEGGGRWVERPGTDHEASYHEARKVFPEEEEVLARAFPRAPPVPERARAAREAVPKGDAPDLAPGTPGGARLEAIVARRLFDPPGLAAAIALAGPEPSGPDGEARLDWLRSLPVAKLRPLPFDALRALVSFEDPAAPLDPRELLPLRRLVDAWTEGGAKPLAASDLAARASAERLGRRALWSLPVDHRHQASGFVILSSVAEVDLDARPGPLPADAPARLGVAPAESFRLAVRLVLKAAGIPERPGNGPVGRPGIEAFEKGAWREVELPPVESR